MNVLFHGSSCKDIECARTVVQHELCGRGGRGVTPHDSAGQGRPAAGAHHGRT